VVSKITRPAEGPTRESIVRVLIAHESQDARDALADAVRRGGDEPLEILTASQGSEALELLLQDDPPEVALVDWDLPAIEGPEMCRLVRDFHHGHDTWLVVLAASRHTDTADAWRAGAAACISTPASPGVLSACVDEGLRKMRPARAHVAAVVCPDDVGHLPEADGRATLDAVRRPDGTGDFYGFGADLRATAELDRDHRPATAAAQPDEPRGAALLQAVLVER
jgi:two-component system chemotaxis response regulator CheY